MEQSGKGLIRIGLVAVMVGCLGMVGCNRHQAHDEDEDEPATEAAQPAADAPAAAEAPPTDASTSASAPAADTSSTASVEPSAAPTAAESASPSAADAPPPAPSLKPTAKKPTKTVASAAPAGGQKAPAVKRPPPAAEALTAWWATGSTSPFTVRAVGSASDRLGVVIVLSKDIGDAAAAGQHIRVLRKGKPITTASWHAGANAHVLVMDPVVAGRYDVIIDGGLASADGQTLDSQLHGPVFVR